MRTIRKRVTKELVQFSKYHDQAQRLWEDANLVEISAKTIDEPRSLVIGQIGNKHWSAVITYRNSIIRIISVRRSRNSEVSLYES